MDVVGDELGTRELTTPSIFSTLALDASPSAVKRLIQTFLKMCARRSTEADRQWRQEARLVEPHALGMMLRWGLAWAVRWVGGHEVRGLVSYDAYMQWRDSEAGAFCCCDCVRLCMSRCPDLTPPSSHSVALPWDALLGVSGAARQPAALAARWAAHAPEPVHSALGLFKAHTAHAFTPFRATALLAGPSTQCR